MSEREAMERGHAHTGTLESLLCDSAGGTGLINRPLSTPEGKAWEVSGIGAHRPPQLTQGLREAVLQGTQ